MFWFKRGLLNVGYLKVYVFNVLRINIFDLGVIFFSIIDLNIVECGCRLRRRWEEGNLRVDYK